MKHALVCAHGYKDQKLHTLPAETIFVSIGAMQTSVTFTLLEQSGAQPLIRLSGHLPPEGWYSRMTSFIENTLALFETKGSYAVDIQQNFPSNNGIASSAALYAALTKGIVHVVGKQMSNARLSTLARIGSYSAAASITGEVSVIRTGELHEDNIAEVVCPAEDFPYRMLVLPVPGIKHSEEIHADILSSPFYEIWLNRVRALSKEVILACSKGAIESLAPNLEAYIFANFATICTGAHNLLSWNAATIFRISFLRELRRKTGIPLFLSVNSGPAVFIYVKPEHLDSLVPYLSEANIDFVISHVGGAATLINSRI